MHRHERSVRTAWQGFRDRLEKHESGVIPKATREFLDSIPENAPGYIPALEKDNESLSKKFRKALEIVLASWGLGTLLGTGLWWWTGSWTTGAVVGAAMLLVAVFVGVAVEVE